MDLVKRIVATNSCLTVSFFFSRGRKLELYTIYGNDNASVLANVCSYTTSP